MKNPYLQELLSLLANRYSVESVGMTTGEWICANTTIKGRPFSFSEYPFQRAITDDLHPDMDVMKISQVGLTEVQIRKMVAFLVRNPGLTGIFSLPNKEMYTKTSQSRIQPLIRENKVFNSEADPNPVRSINTLSFGSSFLHVVNATESSATSIPADIVFNDEVDLSDPKMVALFGSRLQNSKWRIKQRFSTPTWTGYGIDQGYGVSDQREYMVKCSACNHWQVPLFDQRWVNIPGLDRDIALSDITETMMPGLDLDASYVGCEHCSSPLDLDDPHREWVAKYPSKTNRRGYRVRPFTTSKISISYIVQELLSYQRRDFVRGWWNTVIGEPYTDSRARLDEGAIRACFGSVGVQDIGPDVPVFVGVDVGQVCHLNLGHMTRDGIHIFAWMTVKINNLINTIKELDQTYRIIAGACDRHPYTPTVDEIRDITQGRIVPVEYRGEAEFKPVKDFNEEVTHWQVNRTRIIDEAAKMVRTQKATFTGFGSQGAVIIEHLRDMIREEDPEKPARWVKLNNNDHYFHSIAFLIGAMKLPGVLDLIDQPDRRNVITFSGTTLDSGAPLFGKKARKTISTTIL